MAPLNAETYGIHLQSQNIQFNEWLAQLTQCLAPWATHVLVGVPTIVNLTDEPIPWHWYIPLYNPISILWRYLVICDRRLRCREWTPGRMAATCTMFWDGKRWSSTELEAEEHLDRLRKPPPYTRTPILSVPMLGTMVVLIQGSQALYELVKVSSSGVLLTQGVASVFFFIAVASLFRLAPAFWITQDFAFRDGRGSIGCDEGPRAPVPALELSELRMRAASPCIESSHSNGTIPTAEGAADSAPKPMPFEGQMHPKAIVWRTAVMSLIFAIFVSQIYHIAHGFASSRSSPASTIALHILYHSLMGVMVILFPYFLCRGGADDVAIACMNSTWYTAWTVVWYLGAATVIAINALEMRRTHCGAYTTYLPSAEMDERLCRYFT
ncbi:hypothetical protein NEMBOFW57_002195 [Staphylotrichum longicolle]|uniref:Uncharacterized protein n=1 Tax=Staphylotrichum longicolle TaxID=669026 RepID=A0AAD4F3U0_9PEZI|nr:hypothetical protein NEMBOFW57_002195 [Staphylotrichum longicolle]